MHRTRIKICGITNIKDALLAVQLGADAIGLNFYPKSPRCVTIAQAKKIVAALPPYITTVALFVDAKPSVIKKILQTIPFDILQFHGDETPQECARYHKPYIKALRINPATNLKKLINNYKSAQGILCDAYHPVKHGGTGECFDWKLIPKNSAKPIILAGGLNPANIKDAIMQVQPYAVDVTSGVERTPGIKERKKLQQFMENVRYADQNKN